jgi:hypothetical protein
MSRRCIKAVHSILRLHVLRLYTLSRRCIKAVHSILRLYVLRLSTPYIKAVRMRSKNCQAKLAAATNAPVLRLYQDAIKGANTDLGSIKARLMLYSGDIKAL